MPAYAYAVLATGWAAWFAPFVLAQRRKGRSAMKVDTRARWGMLLQTLSYAVVWQSHFWVRTPAAWKMVLTVAFLAVAALLSWTGTRALGREWRLDAGVDTAHRLVRSGPYRFVRHPIYTSMLAVLLGTGILLDPPWLLALAVVVFLAGTEIRARTEDRLLAAHFGPEFEEFRRAVPAYIPRLTPYAAGKAT